jgi:chromosome segregation ATPase
MSILDKFRPDAALVEKVTGLEASLADTENQVTEISAQLLEAQNDLATAINELSETKNKITEFESKITEISAERDTASASLTEAQAKVTELESAVVTAQESANIKALEIAAQAGLAPLNVSSDESPIDHLAHIKNLSPAEKTAYVKKHKKEIQLQLTK